LKLNSFGQKLHTQAIDLNLGELAAGAAVIDGQNTPPTMPIKCGESEL